MSININGAVLSEKPTTIKSVSRAMDYGDGLFETIRVFRGKTPFMHLHWARLKAGMQVLGFDIPDNWSEQFFREQVLKIAEGNARIRITVWRTAGGFYLPIDNKPCFQITAAALDSDTFKYSGTGLEVQLCENIRLPVDALSGMKTLGATRYVLAALEARAKAIDDVVVLNQHGYVCETSNSNILWVKGDTVFAPATADGQVSGTFQKILFGLLRAEGIRIVEKSTTFAELLEADEIMITNAIQGIRWVRFLEGKEFTCNFFIKFNNLTAKYLAHLIA